MTLFQEKSKFSASADIGREPLRPFYHFTPTTNWMNDPNGLVYFEGEYHLFYQYNPFGKSWGHMSWGHAVSRDLVSWKELPVAIPETEFMVFSGCALIDWHNVSGLGDGERPPMLAFYTGFHQATNRQVQHVAYSHDKGRTWHHYAGNPILDLDMEHFRDPNVFWHPEQNIWCMVVAHSADHLVEFYTSENLLDWTRTGSFGPAGHTGGLWECPDLFEVPIEGRDGDTAWVLKIDVDKHLIGEGSGAQYFVGDFDGAVFTPLTTRDGRPRAEIADFGAEFYAAITWSDLPKMHTFPVWIGWMSNHQSGHSAPTDPWRGAQTIARELFLFEEDGTLKLGQRPVPTLEALAGPAKPYSDVSLREGGEHGLLLENNQNAWLIEFTLGTNAHTDAGLKLMDQNGGRVFVGYDRQKQQVFVDRIESKSDFHDTFPKYHAAPVGDVEQITFKVLIDRSSVEVFVNQGQRVLTDAIYPKGQLSYGFYCYEGSAQFKAIQFAPVGQNIEHLTKVLP